MVISPPGWRLGWFRALDAEIAPYIRKPTTKFFRIVMAY